MNKLEPNQYWESCSKCGIVNIINPLEKIGWQVLGKDKFCKCGNQIQFSPNLMENCQI